MQRATPWKVWLARVTVCLVLVWNLTAAVPFILWPTRYLGAFQVAGTGGEALVRGLGIAFLMWQVAFLPVIWQPNRQQASFVVVLGMQLVGLTGESLMLVALPAGNEALLATGVRFVVFDASGLVLMGLAYWILWRGRRQSEGGESDPAL